MFAFLILLLLLGFLHQILLPYITKTPRINSAPLLINSTRSHSQKHAQVPLESSPQIEIHWKNEQHFLKSIGRLFFKKMTPSSILLGDPYFIPSDNQDVQIYQDEIYSSVKCERSGKLIILVPSKPDSIADRLSIRNTWGSVAQRKRWPLVDFEMDVTLIFVIGLSGAPQNSSHVVVNKTELTNEVPEKSVDNRFNISSRVVKSQGSLESLDRPGNMTWSIATSPIQSEIDMYGDILLISTIDTYRNLTRKILRAMKWTLEHCHSAKYILKVDQDIFVNIPMIWIFLKHYGRVNSIYGYVYGSGSVERVGKWGVSRLTLPIDTYPIYVSGNSYILSLDAAAKIVDMAPRFPCVPVEDAFITGILASVTKVDRINVEGFTRWSFPTPYSCQFVADKIYSGNNVNGHFKRRIWHDLIEKRTLCK